MSGSTKRPVFMWISLVIMALSGVMGIDRVPNGRDNPAGLLKTSSDPIYASSAISINPYPTLAGEPTFVAVDLQNPTSNEIAISVAFSYAEFGIGLPFYPIDGVINLVIPPHGIAQPAVVLIPPHGGLWCFQVVVAMPDQQEIIAQRNIDVIEPLLPGVIHELTFPVGNPLDHAVDITMASVAHVSGWGIELNPAVLLNMQAGEVRLVTLSVTPPQGTPLPPDGTMIVDVEAYAGHQLIGGFRKIFRPPVPLHPFPDPPYAEREITVTPYPPRARRADRDLRRAAQPDPLPPGRGGDLLLGGLRDRAAVHADQRAAPGAPAALFARQRVHPLGAACLRACLPAGDAGVTGLRAAAQPAQPRRERAAHARRAAIRWSSRWATR